MLSVADAQALVLRHASPLAGRDGPIEAASLGMVVAEDVASDIDMPPFDKALMDGYAVRSADVQGGNAALRVIGELTAGDTPRQALGSGQAVRIMTGAPIPQGADAVVMVERTSVLDHDRVRIEDNPVPAGKNILPRGREMRRGETVLRAGAVLRPQEFGLLATLGRTHARCYPRPSVAVLATGNELVEPGVVPGPGQIRNGNGPMLLGLVRQEGITARYLGIARDDRAHLTSLVASGLRDADVLILSGGVSAGKLDLVPGVLEEQGITAHFHKVALKPGKPILFGTRNGQLVFGLPGNPVSSLVGFELFVRPALRRLSGHADPGPSIIHAAVRGERTYQTDRPTYHPARLEESETCRRVTLCDWFGSPDLRAMAGANALAVLPAGETRLREGEPIPVLRLPTNIG